MIFEFVTEQGIVSHLDIWNVDITYKVRLFVTNKKKWKSDFGLLWRYLRDIRYISKDIPFENCNWQLAFNVADFIWSICAVIK